MTLSEIHQLTGEDILLLALEKETNTSQAIPPFQPEEISP